MSYFKKICFICLNVNKDTSTGKDVENREQIKYVLPEIINFDSTTRICLSCRNSLTSVYMFKKKCLRNYCRLKHDGDQIITAERELDIVLKFNKNIAEPLQTSEEEDEDTQNSSVSKKIESSSVSKKIESSSVSKKIESETNTCDQLIKESDIPFNTTEDVTETALVVQQVNLQIMKNVKNSKDACEDSYRYRCANCDFKTHQKGSLTKHMRNLHPTGGKHVKCPTCFKNFTNLQQHIEKNTCHRNVFKCEICNKVISNPQNVKRHMQMHAGIKEFKCTICKKEFLQKAHYERHLLIHKGIKNFKCLVCEKAYAELQSLRNHIPSHNDSKDLKCNLCSKIFSCAESLIEHKESEHNMKNYFGNYKCTKCNMRFTSLRAFNLHEKHHNKEKKYKCNLCDKKFYFSNNLLLHTKSHLGIKKYECNICYKAYSDKQTFTEHVMRHEQDDL